MLVQYVNCEMAREDNTTTWREENTIYIEGPWVTNFDKLINFDKLTGQVKNSISNTNNIIYINANYIINDIHMYIHIFKYIIYLWSIGPTYRHENLKNWFFLLPKRLKKLCLGQKKALPLKKFCLGQKKALPTKTNTNFFYFFD